MKVLATAAIVFLACIAAAYADKAIAPSCVRADFQIAGASCAACIMRIEKFVSKVPGVIKVGISIHRPYNAVLIFDPGKVSVRQLEESVKKQEKTVRFGNLTQQPISRVPVLLIPRTQ